MRESVRQQKTLVNCPPSPWYRKEHEVQGREGPTQGLAVNRQQSRDHTALPPASGSLRCPQLFSLLFHSQKHIPQAEFTALAAWQSTWRNQERAAESYDFFLNEGWKKSEVYIPFVIFSPDGHPAVFEHPQWQGHWNLQSTLLPSLSSFAVNRIPSPFILCAGRPQGRTSARPLWKAVNWAATVFASLSLTTSNASKGRAGSEFIFSCPEI